MSLNSSKTHPKILHFIELCLLNYEWNIPYYGEMCLHMNIHRRDNDPSFTTAGVNINNNGMNLYYNTKFIDSLTQEQTNFLMIHELFHLLFNHNRRTVMGGYDHKLSNIAQDMIINSIIKKDFKPFIVDIPKDSLGRNIGVFMPKKYKDIWVYEVLYDWLKNTKEEYDKRKEKKEDNKIFGELFIKKNRAELHEVNISSYKHQHSQFLDILETASKDEVCKYMQNFTRKCLVSVYNGKVVKLFGHTSSITPNGESDDYNQKLSERRVNLFKNAIIETMDIYMDVYSLCMLIIDYEKNSHTDTKKIKYVLQYEEVTNVTLIEQRKKELVELNTTLQKGIPTKFELIWKQYRFTELLKMDSTILKNLIGVHGIQIPNSTQKKQEFINMAQELIITEGKGDKELLIINDNDDSEPILRDEIAKNPKYKTLKGIHKTEDKQYINRRVEYKFDESMDDNTGVSSESGIGEGYGENGQNGEECSDLERIFDDMENNDGQFMDQHIDDDVPPEMREEMINTLKDKLKARGLQTADIEKTLEKLEKKKRDYLKDIKRAVSQIKGSIKRNTITKPNRNCIIGLKGKKKYGFMINVILDCSGSMMGYSDKALNYIFRRDIQCNLIIADTEIKKIYNIKSMVELKKVTLKGFGGTRMQPAFDHITNSTLNRYNTLLLTDGYTDKLNLGTIKGSVLVISCNVPVPIDVKPKGKLKQICIKNSEW